MAQESLNVQLSQIKEDKERRLEATFQHIFAHAPSNVTTVIGKDQCMQAMSYGVQESISMMQEQKYQNTHFTDSNAQSLYHGMNQNQSMWPKMQSSDGFKPISNFKANNDNMESDDYYEQFMKQISDMEKQNWNQNDIDKDNQQLDSENIQKSDDSVFIRREDRTSQENEILVKDDMKQDLNNKNQLQNQFQNYMKTAFNNYDTQQQQQNFQSQYLQLKQEFQNQNQNQNQSNNQNQNQDNNFMNYFNTNDINYNNNSYYQSMTESGQQVIENSVSFAPEWAKVRDTFSHKIYFWNKTNNEVVWNLQDYVVNDQETCPEIARELSTADLQSERSASDLGTEFMSVEDNEYPNSISLDYLIDNQVQDQNQAMDSQETQQQLTNQNDKILNTTLTSEIHNATNNIPQQTLQSNDTQHREEDEKPYIGIFMRFFPNQMEYQNARIIIDKLLQDIDTSQYVSQQKILNSHRLDLNQIGSKESIDQQKISKESQTLFDEDQQQLQQAIFPEKNVCEIGTQVNFNEDPKKSDQELQQSLSNDLSTQDDVSSEITDNESIQNQNQAIKYDELDCLAQEFLDTDLHKAELLTQEQMQPELREQNNLQQQLNSDSIQASNNQKQNYREDKINCAYQNNSQQCPELQIQDKYLTPNLNDQLQEQQFHTITKIESDQNIEASSTVLNHNLKNQNKLDELDMIAQDFNQQETNVEAENKQFVQQTNSIELGNGQNYQVQHKASANLPAPQKQLKEKPQTNEQHYSQKQQKQDNGSKHHTNDYHNDLQLNNTDSSNVIQDNVSQEFNKGCIQNSQEARNKLIETEGNMVQNASNHEQQQQNSIFEQNSDQNDKQQALVDEYNSDLEEGELRESQSEQSTDQTDKQNTNQVDQQVDKQYDRQLDKSSQMAQKTKNGKVEKGKEEYKRQSLKVRQKRNSKSDSSSDHSNFLYSASSYSTSHSSDYKYRKYQKRKNNQKRKHRKLNSYQSESTSSYSDKSQQEYYQKMQQHSQTTSTLSTNSKTYSTDQNSQNKQQQTNKGTISDNQNSERNNMENINSQSTNNNQNGQLYDPLKDTTDQDITQNQVTQNQQNQQMEQNLNNQIRDDISLKQHLDGAMDLKLWAERIIKQYQGQIKLQASISKIQNVFSELTYRIQDLEFVQNSDAQNPSRYANYIVNCISGIHQNMQNLYQELIDCQSKNGRKQYQQSIATPNERDSNVTQNQNLKHNETQAKTEQASFQQNEQLIEQQSTQNSNVATGTSQVRNAMYNDNSNDMSFDQSQVQDEQNIEKNSNELKNKNLAVSIRPSQKTKQLMAQWKRVQQQQQQENEEIREKKRLKKQRKQEQKLMQQQQQELLQTQQQLEQQ